MDSKVHLAAYEALVKYMKRGFKLKDMCVHIGRSRRGYECLGAERSTDDGHMCALSFKKEKPVFVSPPVRWKLGVPGKPTSVALKVRRGWAAVGG